MAHLVSHDLAAGRGRGRENHKLYKWQDNLEIPTEESKTVCFFAYVYDVVCVCMNVHTCWDMHICAYTHTWGMFLNYTSFYMLKQGLSMDHRACPLGWTDWQAAMTIWFYSRLWDLNSCSYNGLQTLHALSLRFIFLEKQLLWLESLDCLCWQSCSVWLGKHEVIVSLNTLGKGMAVSREEILMKLWTTWEFWTVVWNMGLFNICQRRLPFPGWWGQKAWNPGWPQSCSHLLLQPFKCWKRRCKLLHINYSIIKY